MTIRSQPTESAQAPGPDLSLVQGLSGVWGTTLPAGRFGTRKAAGNGDFLGPLWHMQDMPP